MKESTLKEILSIQMIHFIEWIKCIQRKKKVFEKLQQILFSTW